MSSDISQHRPYWAKISKGHHVLEIGCGWGSLAIELVKRTGCQYTGITLSEEQLKFAQQKVKEAGLQDNIRLLLCDYRQLPEYQKYDRIISCEMLEAVGHEYVEKFFCCVESALSENGIFVMQVKRYFDIFDTCIPERIHKYCIRVHVPVNLMTLSSKISLSLSRLFGGMPKYIGFSDYSWLKLEVEKMEYIYFVSVHSELNWIEKHAWLADPV